MESALPLPAPELIAKYGVSGPRYTSYPPATEWTGDFPAASVEEALARADAAGGPLSLYVHLPFCEEMCRFCGCNVIATRDRSRADDYLDLLEREAALWAERLPRRRALSQLHLGGGTPTFLSPTQLRRLHRILTTHFLPTDGAELAIEVDPAVTTVEHVAALGELGFRRISVGVQDLEPVVQEAVRRVQSAEDTEKIIRAARAAGFTGVNVDLIYGLPFQEPESYARTIRRVIEMGPDRLALFGYAHVPWMKPHQRLLPVAHLPDSDLRVKLFVTAARIFEESGYRQIGLDHFARADDALALARAEGTLTRNFQGYAVDAAPDTVALGMTAIADVGGTFLQNAHRLSDWAEAVGNGRLSVTRGWRRTEEDELRGAIIRRIMCLYRLDTAPLAEAYGDGIHAAYEAGKAALEPLAEDGLLHFRPGGFDVTLLGRLFLRNIAMVFDPYLAKRDQTKAAFSRTV